MAQVFQVLEPSFGFEDHSFPDEYVLVATVASEDVDKVYELTNTIDKYWWENEGVTKEFVGEGCRSTSIGDIIVLDSGERLRCENVGWARMSTEP